MITSDEHQALYWEVRSAILGRHFAIGGRARANLMSLDNTLSQQLPSAAASLPELRRRVLERWNVASRMRENPLMWSGKLLAAVAAEHALGSPQAERVAVAALDSFEALYRFHRMDHFDGYVVRWDPATSDDWIETADTRYSGAFLVDADEKNYLYCVPHRDPRHVPRRVQATLDRLMTPAQQSEYMDNFQVYFDNCRPWECSMDELVGLVGAYGILFELVPTQAVRSRVASQASRLADYLAEHGYLLVRPEGGLNYRGATGLLPALEAPFNRVFKRVTGSDFPARTDFVGAMRQAGYWRLLQLPVDRVAAGLTVASVLASPLLTAWLASGEPIATVVSQVLGGALGAGTATVPPSIRAAAPLIMPALPRSIGLHVHNDVFDVSEQDEPALAHLLSVIPPDLRFRVCADVSTLLPPSAGENARGFLPYVGLSAVGDPSAAIGQEYLRLMRLHRQGPLGNTERTDLLYSCFASALALLLGADASEEQALTELLAIRHDQVAPIGPDGTGLPGDGQVEFINAGLDYLAGLSLAWLHARRRADQGNPVTTPGFPLPPAGAWPQVRVPADAVNYLPDVAQALGASPPSPDIDLFAATAPTVRSAPAPLVLPPVDGHVVVDHVSVQIRDTDGDVATGVVLEPGDEFEVTASGTITAPESLAQPSDANGWYVVDDATFALHSGIDPDAAHKYALLGRLGGYFFIGTHRPRQRFLYRRATPLYLRINNDDHRRGAGQGAFDVEITAWGPPRLRGQFLGFSLPRQVPPNTPQRIALRFRNLGSAWESSGGFRLVLTPGQADAVWSPAEVPVTTLIPPRGIADFEFDIVTPATLGSYRMSWTLMAGDQAVATTGGATVQVVASRCVELRSLIASIPAEIRGLQAGLAGAAPAEKAAIAGQIRALRAGLANARSEAQRLGCPS
jgi:hypothetical protein